MIKTKNVPIVSEATIATSKDGKMEFGVEDLNLMVKNLRAHLKTTRNIPNRTNKNFQVFAFNSAQYVHHIIVATTELIEQGVMESDPHGFLTETVTSFDRFNNVINTELIPLAKDLIQKEEEKAKKDAEEVLAKEQALVKAEAEKVVTDAKADETIKPVRKTNTRSRVSPKTKAKTTTPKKVVESKSAEVVKDTTVDKELSSADIASIVAEPLNEHQATIEVLTKTGKRWYFDKVNFTLSFKTADGTIKVLKLANQGTWRSTVLTFLVKCSEYIRRKYRDFKDRCIGIKQTLRFKWEMMKYNAKQKQIEIEAKKAKLVS